MTTASVPNIILVGGPFVADDGTSLDSRQALKGDLTGRVLRQALGTSWHWWRTAVSLTTPLLREHKGKQAFIQGPRSVIDVRHDGELKRTRLGRLLGEPIGEILTTPAHEGAPDGYTIEDLHPYAQWGTEPYPWASRRTNEDARWYFLDGFPVPPAAKFGACVGIGPDILPSHDPDQATKSSSYLKGIEETLAIWEGCTVIAPDSGPIRQTINGFMQWVNEGRPHRWIAKTEVRAWNPMNRDPMEFMKIVPVSANFGVTGLFREGTWHDPGPLESARALLESRYDYQFGLWDLLDNDSLRTALLADTLIPAVPPGPAVNPTTSVSRAVSDARAAEARHIKSRHAAEAMAAALTAAGWVKEESGYRVSLTLPLTKLVQRRPGFDMELTPAAWLWVNLLKRQTQVCVRSINYSPDSYNSLQLHRDTFQAHSPASLAPFREADAVIWRDEGGLSDQVDWLAKGAAIADATPHLRLGTEGFAAAALTALDQTLDLDREVVLNTWHLLPGHRRNSEP